MHVCGTRACLTISAIFAKPLGARHRPGIQYPATMAAKKRREAGQGRTNAGAREEPHSSDVSSVRVKCRGVRLFAVPTLLCALAAWRLVVSFTAATELYGVREWWLWAGLVAVVWLCGRPLRRRITLEPTLALVTGSSRGIGLEIANCLAGDGHSVIICGRDEVKLDAVAKSLRHSYPAIDVHVAVKDLSLPGAGEALYADLAGRGLAPELLVNCAGFGFGHALWETPAPQLGGMLQCNVVNLTTLTRLYIDDMRRRGGGKMLNVSSIAGLQPVPWFAAYAASKAYIHHLTLALGVELATAGSSVTVTSLCPGATATDFGQRAGVTSAMVFKMGLVCSPQFVARRGYDAWMAGEAWCVPGIIDYVCTMLAASVMPYSLSTRTTGLFMRV